MTPESALKADRIGGVIWVLFGALIVYGSYVMDRLPSLNIPPLTAPGLVPGLLGLGIMVFGAILMLRRHPAALTGVEDQAHPESHIPDETDWRRLALSWLLCVTYAGALLGRGLPYWALTAVFLAAHLLLIDESNQTPARPDRTRVITAVILAPVFAVIVALTFQHIFLVRLP